MGGRVEPSRPVGVVDVVAEDLRPKPTGPVVALA